MADSDRIAVMKDGDIQHVGSPKDLYQRPANLFVATFIGRTNIVEAKMVVKDNKTIIKFPMGYDLEMHNILDEERHDQDVIVSIRPEEFVINESSHEGIKASVDDSVFLGLNTHYFVHLDSEEKAEIIQESRIDNSISKATQVYLTVKQEKVNIFNSNGTKNLVKGVKNDGDIYSAKVSEGN